MEDAPLLVTLADLYSTAGEFEAAAQVLAAGARRPDAAPELRLRLGQARLRLGDFAGTEKAVLPLTKQWEALSETDRQWIARAGLMAADAAGMERLFPKTTSDPEWLALRGLQQQILGRPVEAVRWLERSVKANPDDVWNQYLLGWAYKTAGSPNKALETWDRAARLPEAPPAALIGAAEILIGQGQLEAGKWWLDRVGKNDQKSPRYWEAQARLAEKRQDRPGALLAAGYAAYFRGDPWEAETLWEKALPLASGEDARELFAGIYNSAFLRQDAPKALRIATQAGTRFPGDPYFLKRRAEVLLGQNRIVEALAVAEKLRQREKSFSAETADLFCRIALDGGKPQLLQKYAEQQIQLAPSDPYPYLHLGEWQAKQGRSPENLEKTLQFYREAMSVSPRNAEARARAGIVLSDMKRDAEAIGMLLDALTLDARVLEGTPHAQLAQLYQRGGQEAEREFHETEYRRLRRLKEVWPTLLKALRQDRSAQEWQTFGETALKQRDTYLALCAFQRAVKLAPQNPAAWRGLAAAWKRSGQFEPGLEAMRRAFALSQPKRVTQR
jgi:tetratricopeptide (TPR) repeat protein